MKKAIVGMLTAALTIALCVIMTACSTGIVGEWKFESMHMSEGGVSVDIKAGEQFMGVTINEDAFILTIKEDNTLEFKVNMGEEATVTGTWEEKDGKYYLTIEGETQEATINGGKLTFENEGATLTLKK